jgi:glycosyltransferase involved in cell wall biosynthesis
MNNLVSVIVPTRNASSTLLCSINSLIQQDYKNLEIIIVDDNTNLEESKYVKQLFKTPKIKIIKSDRPFYQKNHIGYLLNLGIKYSQGDFIARQDSDDFSVVNRISTQMKQIYKDGYDLVGGQNVDINIFGNYISTSLLPRGDKQISTYSQFENPFVHSSVIFSRESFVELGGYSEILTNGQDYELWNRYIDHKRRVCNLKKILVFCLKSRNSISSTSSKYVADRIKINPKSIAGIRSQIISIQILNGRRFYHKLFRESKFNLNEMLNISMKIHLDLIKSQAVGFLIYLVNRKLFNKCLNSKIYSSKN